VAANPPQPKARERRVPCGDNNKKEKKKEGRKPKKTILFAPQPVYNNNTRMLPWWYDTSRTVCFPIISRVIVAHS
jgi:hypothetical protein